MSSINLPDSEKQYQAVKLQMDNFNNIEREYIKAQYVDADIERSISLKDDLNQVFNKEKSSEQQNQSKDTEKDKEMEL